MVVWSKWVLKAVKVRGQLKFVPKGLKNERKDNEIIKSDNEWKADGDTNKEGRKTTRGDEGVSILIFSFIACCSSFSVSNKNKLHNPVCMSTKVSAEMRDTDLWGSSEGGGQEVM